MRKNVLFVLSLLFAVTVAPAAVIVDDNLEGPGDSVADYAGQIVTPWAGCGSRTGTYWRFNNHNDEEPGVGVDGDGLPLEVVNGNVGQLNIDLDGNGNTAPQTVTVTYAGQVERGVYTIRLQAGTLNLKSPVQASEMEITLGGMLPKSVDAPAMGGDNDAIWTLQYESTAADVGQPLTLEIHVPSLTHNYYFTLDHVEIGLVLVSALTNPIPYDGQGIVDDNLISGADNIVLSWTNGLAEDATDPNLLVPNPDVTGYYVYINDVPNMAGVTPISTTDTSKSIGVVGYNALKYWRVDQVVNNKPLGDPNNIVGTVWSFATESAHPTVDAGPDLYASLAMAQSGLTLNGSYSDVDGTATASTWQVITGDASYPGGTQSFADASSPVTTFTTDTAGRFLLKLNVPDPMYPDTEFSDMIEVIVVADDCAAAKGSPDGYARNAYDLNDDCIVNLLDFAAIAENWLADTLMDAPVENDSDAVYIEVPAAAHKLGGIAYGHGDNDGWTQCGINIADTYTNNSGAAQTIDLKYVAFHAYLLAESPMTPFVAEVVDTLPDPDLANYKVVAIGTTRTSSDYTPGKFNVFDFADTPAQITLAEGATMAIGFLDANPDGSGSAAPKTVVTFTYPGGAQTLVSGGNQTSESASIKVGMAPTHNASESLQLTNRQYNFVIGFDVH